MIRRRRSMWSILPAPRSACQAVRILIARHNPSRESRKGPFSALPSRTDRPTGGFRSGYRCQAAIYSPGIIRRGSSRRCCIASATISSISSSVFGLRGPDRRPVMWLARAGTAEVDRPGHGEEFLLVGHGILGPGRGPVPLGARLPQQLSTDHYSVASPTSSPIFRSG